MIVFQTTEGVLIDRGYLMKTHNEVAVIYRLVNAEASDRTASRAAGEAAVLPARPVLNPNAKVVALCQHASQ